MPIPLLNYIKKIFQSIYKESESTVTNRILGISCTDLYEYGVIYRVLGESLTDLNIYSYIPPISANVTKENEQSQEIELKDIETISLNDYQKDDVDLEEERLSLAIDESIQLDEFKNLESIFIESINSNNSSLINASDTLGKLKGSDLYESLQKSEEVRNKISILLDRVSANQTAENSEMESCLLDMSEFLNT